MTAPRTYPYAIHYNDGSYMIYDLTKADFETITTFLLEAPDYIRGFVKVSIGLLNVDQIRSIIEQREQEVIQEQEGANPDLPLSYINFLKGSEEA